MAIMLVWSESLWAFKSKQVLKQSQLMGRQTLSYQGEFHIYVPNLTLGSAHYSDEEGIVRILLRNL